MRRVSGEIEKRRILPELVGTGRALVYAATRKSTERAAEALRAAGRSAETYHAGMDDAGRTRVQERFADGSLPIVCATNAFGMGIDRPDVEAVVHFEIPGSLEAYYQEIGRGGRDGRRADCTLLWNYVDVRTRKFLIEQSDESASTAARRALDLKKLERMVGYADSSSCYRATILAYFGERDAPRACGGCGNCERRRALSDEELLRLRKILSGVARGGQRWGRRRIAAMLTGRIEGLPDSLTALSTTGILAGESEKAVGDWIDAAIGANLLAATDDAYRTLSLTRAGREVMAGRDAQVALTPPASPAPRAPRRRTSKVLAAAARAATAGPVTETAEPADPARIEALREWRRAEAARRAVPAFVILHDRTLAAVAMARPATLSALAAIPGIGPAKLEAYGQAILDLLHGAAS